MNENECCAFKIEIKMSLKRILLFSLLVLGERWIKPIKHWTY